MGAWDASAAATSLSAALGLAAYPTISGTHLRLGTTAPTAVAAMTELSSSGYTAGGQAISWAAPSGNPAATYSTSSPSWVNGSASVWALVGAEIWTTQATPVRQFQGIWAGAPVQIAPGDTFAPAAGALTLAQS